MKLAQGLFLLVLVGWLSTPAFSQSLPNKIQSLPPITATYQDGIEQDWLIDANLPKSGIFRNEKGNEITLSNGLISRTFRLSPNAATVSLKVLGNQQEMIRAVKPEAIVSINGFTFNVGGLEGQPNLAFLYPDWLESLTANPLSFKLSDFQIGSPKKRMEWKQVRHHAPNVEWPPKGVNLQMDYQLDDLSPEDLLALSMGSSLGRKEIYHDDFTTLSNNWQLRTSPAHERSSFMNEGKPGEIYTPNNTAVYAEYKLPQGVGLVETSIDAGTDQSGLWGPGIALVWKDRTIKFNMRPGNESGARNNGAWRFTVYDGKRENTRAGGKDNVDFNQTWWLRLRIEGNNVLCEARPKDGIWKVYQAIDFEQSVEDPIAVRIGKLGRNAEGVDHEFPGEMVRLKFNQFAAYSRVEVEELQTMKKRLNELKALTVSVHYELYDGIPVLSKWVEVKNQGNVAISIDNVVSEYLGVADHDPYGGYRDREDLKVKPNLHVETDYAFSAGRAKVANRHTVHWLADQDYVTKYPGTDIPIYL